MQLDPLRPFGGTIGAPLGEATARLAALWRASRNAEVAVELGILSNAYAGLFTIAVPRRGPTFARALGRIDALLDVLLRAVTRGPEKTALWRLDALVERAGDDPRLVPFLERWAAVAPYGRGAFTRRVEALRTTPAAGSGRALDGDGLDVLADAIALRLALPARQRALQLLRAVYASPRDPSLRLVLADALLEIDDPWGELIMLQHGPSTDASEERQKELLRAHEHAWLGRLAGIVKDVRFEGGFPAFGVSEWGHRFARIVAQSTLTDLRTSR